jgi:diguanylate cyclase (GGDEF)-like protein
MKLQTAMIILHLIGLVIGLGAATVADILFMKGMRRNRINHSEFEFLKAVTNLVIVGLGLLSISGIGFLFLYQVNTPELLNNPKLWAKVTIVTILVVNGWVMHHHVLPWIGKNLNRPLFSSTEILKRKTLFFGTGAVSGVSWWASMLLGTWKELNFKYSYFEVFGIYSLLLIGALVGSYVMGHLLIAVAKKSHFVSERASDRKLIDEGTGAFNARFAEEALSKEIARAQQHSIPLSIIHFDLDDFAIINKKFGDMVGDHILREISDLFRGMSRASDVFARVGGDEFVILLPQTSTQGAKIVAERIRSVFENTHFDIAFLTGPNVDKKVQLTASFGITELNQGRESAHVSQLFSEAEMFTLKAKIDGKNRIASKELLFE